MKTESFCWITRVVCLTESSVVCSITHQFTVRFLQRLHLARLNEVLFLFQSKLYKFACLWSFYNEIRMVNKTWFKVMNFNLLLIIKLHLGSSLIIFSHKWLSTAFTEWAVYIFSCRSMFMPYYSNIRLRISQNEVYKVIWISHRLGAIEVLLTKQRHIWQCTNL